mmetsp:Transcript_64224/g.153153  ORF Transcript_64224/g.153153 Transcript_64224/m.153153 type:complete len:217 (-) Transcript_64224:243-893(-)
MLGTKSLCPGASKMVNLLDLVEKCFTQTSMVTPRCRSSSPSSRTQAYAKDALPACLDSFSYLWMVFDDTSPTKQRRWPMRVDFPASTCPTTTKLRLGKASSAAAGAGGASSDSASSTTMSCSGSGSFAAFGFVSCFRAGAFSAAADASDAVALAAAALGLACAAAGAALAAAGLAAGLLAAAPAFAAPGLAAALAFPAAAAGFALGFAAGLAQESS